VTACFTFVDAHVYTSNTNFSPER